jgi:hypothetical protein
MPFSLCFLASYGSEGASKGGWLASGGEASGRPWRRGDALLPLSAAFSVGVLRRVVASFSSVLAQWWSPGVAGVALLPYLSHVWELLPGGYGGLLRRPDRNQRCRAPLPLFLPPILFRHRRGAVAFIRDLVRIWRSSSWTGSRFCTRSRVFSTLLQGLFVILSLWGASL